jgi:hypothetical protein
MIEPLFVDVLLAISLGSTLISIALLPVPFLITLIKQIIVEIRK